MKYKSVIALLVPLLCATQDTTQPPCDWRFLWPSGGADTSGGYLPPNTTQCHLYFSDTLTLVNTGPAERSIYRLASQAGFNSCDISQLFPGARSVSVPAGGAYSLTLSRGSSNPWDFLLLDSVYLVSPGEGGCLQLAFFVSSDTSRDCSITHGGGACYVPFPQTTTTTTTTTTTISTYSATNSDISNGNNEVSLSNRSCEDSCIPHIPGNNITFHNTDAVTRHVYLLSNYSGALECDPALAQAGNITLPPNSSVSFRLGQLKPWILKIDRVMFLLVTSGDALCSCRIITVTPFSCSGTNTSDGSYLYAYFVSALAAAIVVTVLAIGMCVTLAYLTEKRKKISLQSKSADRPPKNNLEFILD